jgi:hypothetical protein
MLDKDGALHELKCMLRDIFAAKARSESYTRMARAHGYADGYMRALLDLGTVTKDELLLAVREERERAEGPSTVEVSANADPIPAAS